MKAKAEPRRRRSPKGESRRQEILDAATKLFSHGGFHTASLADIADAVGLTQAGLLHYFPSKAELLLAVLRQREERVLVDETADAANKGIAYAEAFVETLRRNEKNPVMVQLFAILSHEAIFTDHPAHPWFRERYAAVVAKATNQLAATIDETRLPPGTTVESIARLMIAAADGLRLQWLLDPKALERPKVMNEFFALLAPYIKKPD